MALRLPAPTDKTVDWPAASLNAAFKEMVEKKLETSRILEGGVFNFNVRRETAAEEGAGTHGKKADLYLIRSGEATLTTDGELISPKPAAAGAEGDVDGTGIRNGKSRVVRTGDVIFIPAGVPHQITAVNGEVQFLLFRWDTQVARKGKGHVSCKERAGGRRRRHASLPWRRAGRHSDLTAFPTTGWLTNGGDLFNRRYSPLTQINRDNVAQLKAVWRTRLNGSGVGVKYSGEAQPIVHEGVIYVITGADDVFAISVDSGETLWSYQAKLDDKISTVCCGWTSRGVGLGDGKVFVGQLDGKLLALDQRTGAVRLVDAGGAMAGRVHHHERAALLRRARHHRLRRRRVRHPRPREGVRCEDRVARLDLLHHSRSRRGRPRHLAEGQRRLAARRRLRLADARGRSGARPPLFLHGKSGARLQRRRARRRQPVRDLDRGRRCEDGKIPLALSAGASRPLGLRRAQPGGALRHRDRRTDAQGDRAGQQDRMGLHPGPHAMDGR